ncbi:hypothetical protein DFJ73DRAFT_838784, partial [Zopfochytrium polystomum]
PPLLYFFFFFICLRRQSNRSPGVPAIAIWSEPTLRLSHRHHPQYNYRTTHQASRLQQSTRRLLIQVEFHEVPASGFCRGPGRRVSIALSTINVVWTLRRSSTLSSSASFPTSSPQHLLSFSRDSFGHGHGTAISNGNSSPLAR